MRKYTKSIQGEKNRLASIPKGKQHWRYEEIPSRSAVHKWINKYYGKANCCENPNCSGESKYYEWALIKGCEYIRKRENFKKLCRKCHTKYDMTAERKKNIINGIKKRYNSNN